MSKYLDFTLIADTGKTKVYGVLSRSQDSRLAIIRWYGAWRQYVLEPEAGTIWNNGCLMEVIAFMQPLMVERSR